MHALESALRLSRSCVRPRRDESIIPVPLTPFRHCHTSIYTKALEADIWIESASGKSPAATGRAPRGEPASGRGGR